MRVEISRLSCSNVINMMTFQEPMRMNAGVNLQQQI